MSEDLESEMLLLPEIIYGVDAGTRESGWCAIEPNWQMVRRGAALLSSPEPPARIINFGIDTNETVRAYMMGSVPDWDMRGDLAIEVMRYYGRKVGQETFQTCEWIGVFKDRWKGRRIHETTHPETGQRVCMSATANDGQIWESICFQFAGDRKAAIGTRKSPGPLYGIKSHARMALATALAVAHRLVIEEQPRVKSLLAAEAKRNAAG